MNKKAQDLLLRVIHALRMSGSYTDSYELEQMAQELILESEETDLKCLEKQLEKLEEWTL